MKKTDWSRLRVLTWAILFAAMFFASCADDKEDTPLPPPRELTNQIEYDGGEPIAIESAIFGVEDTDLYTFYLSPSPGITDIASMEAAKDYLRILVRNPRGTVDTASEPFEISYKDIFVKGQSVNDAVKVELSADFAAGTSLLDLKVGVTLESGRTLRVRYNHTCPEAAPQPLDNQYELDSEVSAIGSVVKWRYPKEGVTTYYFYTDRGVEAPSVSKPAGLEITLADGVEAANIDLSTADPGQVSISCGEFGNTAGTTGTLGIVGNEAGAELTVTLDARKGGSRLRARYAGSFASGYESSDRIRITAAGISDEADLHRVFRYKESIMNNYAFGLADAESPADLMAGRYAVELGLSNIGIGTTIDLATEASRCTFVLHDYVNYMSYDISKDSGRGATGTITTAGTAERIYLRLSVAFPDGPTVEGEWYGEVTNAEEMFDLRPVKPFVPHITIVSSEGDVLSEQNLSAMEVRLENNYRLRGGDPQYGGATFDAYFIYFRPENSSSSIESFDEVPRLMIPASYLNSSDLDLSAPRDDLHWSFKFSNSNLQQPEYSETYTMYGMISGYCPDEVRTTVVRNADKTWTVSFAMKDSYPSTWNPDRKEGYQNTVTVEWEGPATKYSGPNKNDLTDDDY
ncbi:MULTISPECIES: hypothetical protein [Alistipes]|jgi:hypothetical protein|uniref:hypothetical protein n=1 Tax=Alistipes TaxID=239759 RepID=UPI001D7BD6B9|nr:hypothetical protein [Alistipes sp.]MBS6100156.1 hypothetical protein [Alistipes sp.]HJI18850.1 hypothetical protein [Rikenellaceae bacterium]